MSNRMFISTKNACVIKRFKEQVNLSEPLYRMTQDLHVQFNSICSSPKHCRYLRLQIILSWESKIVYLYLKNNWNSNFTKLSTAEAKIITTSQIKNAQARRTSSFEILQARDRFYWPQALDHRLISKTVCIWYVNW